MHLKVQFYGRSWFSRHYVLSKDELIIDKVLQYKPVGRMGIRLCM